MKATKNTSAVMLGVLALALGALTAPPAAAAPEPVTAGVPARDPVTSPSAKRGKGTIRGTVTFRGKPVRKLWVQLESKKKTLAARTDKHGRFRAAVPPGKYTAHAFTYRFSAFQTYSKSTVHAAQARRVTVRRGKSATLNLDLIPSATVKGKVVDAAGRPVKKATVAAWNTKRAGDHHEIRTDKRGRFEAIHLATGKVKVIASKGGGRFAARGTVEVRAVEGRTVRTGKIVLRKPAKSRITVDVHGVDDYDGYVSVRAYRPDGFWVTLSETDKYDPFQYQVQVPPGPWRVIISGTNEMTDVVTTTAGQTVHAGELRVPTVFTEVSGRVLLPDGTPLVKDGVDVKDPLGGGSSWSPTGPDGSYTVTGVPEGDYTLEVNPRDSTLLSVSEPIHVTAGEPVVHDIVLVRGHTVRGKVVHRGKGVPDIMVYAPGAQPATTGPKGKFVLRGVPSGKLVFWAEDDASGGFKYRKKVVRVTQDMTGLRIRLR